MLTHFSEERMAKRHSFGYYYKVNCLLLADIPCFSFHYPVLCLTKANVNVQLAQIYRLCKVTVSRKACPVFHRYDTFRTCTNDPNLTAKCDVNAYYL